MTTAVKQWNQRWGASRLDRCEAGHVDHDWAWLDVSLRPGERPVEDCPSVPTPVAFVAAVFQSGRYEGHPMYCTGDDEVSRSLAEQGCWEPWQTALTVDILAAPGEGTFVDLGSHVGWYSLVAMALGRAAYALDADLEHVALARRAAAANGWDGMFRAAVGWLDESSVPLRAEETGRVRLAKVDLEGAEIAAARTLSPLLAAHAVDFVVMEVTPEFGGGWRKAVAAVEAVGYTSHLLPDKGDDVDAFERSPLAATLAMPPPSADLDAQATILFALP